MSDPLERLALPRCAAVVAPAGCGKTTLIAGAVSGSTGSQLILTHTHAGVDALRRKLASLRVPKSKYQIDTISGWALGYVASYPGLSGLELTEPSGSDWPLLPSAMQRALDSAAVRNVLRASYSGVFVDEYQDCTLAQHRLLAQVAELLPVRVLGDPLQGIFSFGGEPMVDFDNHVSTVFGKPIELDIPYRWRGKNEQLGRWLMQLRHAILEDRTISLASAPLHWIDREEGMCQSGCKGCAVCAALPGRDSVALMYKWNNRARRTARISGRFQAIEEMDCKRLTQFAKAVDACAQVIELAKEIVKLVKDCYTKADEILKDRMVTTAFSALRGSRDIAGTLAVLEAVTVTRIGHRHRSELWFEALRALGLYLAHPGRFAHLSEAAWNARNVTRRIGRRLPQRVTSTTLLLKGLEFDHAIVASALDVRDPGKPADVWLGSKNLYVAATRSSKSLTVFSANADLDHWRP